MVTVLHCHLVVALRVQLQWVALPNVAILGRAWHQPIGPIDVGELYRHYLVPIATFRVV